MNVLISKYRKRKILNTRNYRKIQDGIFVWSIVIPAMAFFTLFIYYPFFKNIYYVFMDYNYIKEPTYVGLRNIKMLFADTYAFNALKNTFLITFVSVPLVLGVSLGLSILLFNLKKFQGVFRSAIFSTYLVPLVVASIIFKLLFGTESGLINSLLQSIGLNKVNWLTNPALATLCIIIINLWNGTGYYMVIFLAGLSNIDTQIYESAKVDGADPFRIFYYITLPSLKPTLIFAAVFATITYLRTFVTVEILTEGGPYRSTETIIKYMFDQGFKYGNVGYASLLALVVFMLTLIISIIQIKLTRSADD
ncbi:MAG: sugar ABC transporter permease [Firmicutes bacterium HGW-Firmicutes-3]|nr:MAG: sugar ABC transporter permease [Firmicutes bacterium HGW-Firmicutes-3]